MNGYNFLSLYAVGILWLVQYCDSSWEVNGYFNKWCQKEQPDLQLVYVKARNGTTSVHTFIAASKVFTVPSILMLRSSSQDAEPQVDCNKLTTLPSKAITLPNLTQSAGAIFFRLVQYDDVNDKADMSSSTGDTSKFHYFSKLNWSYDSNSTLEPAVDTGILKVRFYARSNQFTSLMTNQSEISLSFFFSNQTQHNSDIPRLIYLAGESMQVAVALDSLRTAFNSSRFGLQLVLYSGATAPQNGDFVTDVEHTLNDEITPGNFKVFNVKMNELVSNISKSKVTGPPAYMQAKPVCYVDPSDRLLKSSRGVLLSLKRDPLPSGLGGRITKSLPFAFYGELAFRNYANTQNPPVMMMIQNISFGDTKDGFYVHSNFTTFTLSLGLGNPPSDQFSSLLIGLISMTVVVVTASLLVIVAFFAFRQYRQRFQRSSGSFNGYTNPNLVDDNV